MVLWFSCVIFNNFFLSSGDSHLVRSATHQFLLQRVAFNDEEKKWKEERTPAHEHTETRRDHLKP